MCRTSSTDRGAGIARGWRSATRNAAFAMLVLLVNVHASRASASRPLVVVGDAALCERYRVLLRSDDVVVRCTERVLANEAELVAFATTLRETTDGDQLLVAQPQNSTLFVYDVARAGAVDLPVELDAQRALLLRMGHPAVVLSSTTSATRAAGNVLSTPAPTTPAAPTPAQQPGWLDGNWPYLAAGGLLAVAVVIVIVVSQNRRSATPAMSTEPLSTGLPSESLVDVTVAHF